MCAWEMSFSMSHLFFVHRHVLYTEYMCVISRNIIENQYTKPQAKYYFV